MTDQELPTEAEERGALPPGWKWTTIDEVTQPVEKIDPRNEPKNKFIYLDISAIDNTTNIITEPQSFYGSKAPSRARQLVSTDDILFSTVRVYLKNIALVSASYNNAVASTGFSILRMEEGVNPRYLFYYCLTRELLHNIGELQKGISYPAVRDSDVRDQAVPLPPKSEQDRIVAELDTQLSRLEAGIAGLKSAQANVERERAAVLNAACLGQLVPQDPADEPAAPLLRRILAERRARWEAAQLAQMAAAGRPPKDDKWKQQYVEPAPPETEGLPELPEGWVWVALPQIGELARGKSKHRPRDDKRLFGGPYPFIQTGDVTHAEGVVTDYQTTYSEFGLAQSRLWPKGTLCITIAANIADSAILGFDACFPDSVVGFISEKGNCNIRFIKYYFDTIKSDLASEAPATAQKNINLNILQNLPIPFPPLVDQNRIVDEVDRRTSLLEETKSNIQVNLLRAERLREMLLQQAFSGQLVAQEPAAESATALLERIRATKQERAAQQKANPRPKGTKMSSPHSVRARRPLYDVLVEAGSPLTPEDLFTQAGFDPKADEFADAIEEFYRELRDETRPGGRIDEQRLNAADVFLKVRPHADR